MDDSMGTASGRGAWGSGSGQGGDKWGMETDLTSGDQHTMQDADDVLLSCTLETHVVLLKSVIPINSNKKEKINSSSL